MTCLENFYHESIQNAIQQCHLQVSMLHRRSHYDRHRAEVSRAQADFLEANKEQLIREMLQSSIGTDRNEINKSLKSAFLKLSPAGTFTAENNGEYLDSVCEGKRCSAAETSLINTFVPAKNITSRSLASDATQYLYDLPWADGSLISEDD